MRSFKSQQQFGRFSFVMLPDCLFMPPLKSQLCLESKVAYAFMLRRIMKSIGNNWKDNDGYYIYFTIEHLTDLLDISKATAIKVMKELKNANLIVSKKRGLGQPNKIYVQELPSFQNEQAINLEDIKNKPQKSKLYTPEVKNLDTSYIEYSYTEYSNNKDILSGDNITPSNEGEYPEKVAEENPNIEVNTNIGVKTKKDTPSKVKEKHKSGNYEGEIKEIVTYLNEKAKKNFRAATTTTQKHIKARLNEGFTVADCKTVIDTKVNDWLYDSKMNEYLRPQTLFGTKFESYLNSAVPKYDVDEVIRKQKERHDRELAEAMERMRQAEMEMKGTNETDTDTRSEGERKCGIRCSLQERRRSLGRNVDS